MTIDIVDFPMNHGDFPYVSHYQRVICDIFDHWAVAAIKPKACGDLPSGEVDGKWTVETRWSVNK